jgi:acylphosphatase
MLPFAMPRVHLIVHGRVQGVGFRWYAVRQARSRGVAGWVRNRDDGAVEAEAEGDRAALDAFVADLRLGPAHAQVTEIEAEWSDPPPRHRTFVIRD